MYIKVIPLSRGMMCLGISVTMLRHNKSSISTDNLKENGIDGLIYLSYGSDLASYKF
jgi:hypothetical protein